MDPRREVGVSGVEGQVGTPTQDRLGVWFTDGRGNRLAISRLGSRRGVDFVLVETKTKKTVTRFWSSVSVGTNFLSLFFCRFQTSF